MRRRAAVAALSGLALAALGGSACTEEDVFVAWSGDKPDADTLDQDPLVLMPGEPVFLSYVDAQALFKTGLAPSAAQFVASVLPIGPESNFVPARDVARVWSGVYAIQGLDFCSVLSGNFDAEAVRRAVASRAVSAAGGPLVVSRYADTELYTAGNVGFTILTSHTALAGSETGIRRALDRLKRSKPTRDVPPWMVELTQTPGVQFTVAGDLEDQPAAEVASRQLPFLDGLRRVRVIGNFEPLHREGSLRDPLHREGSLRDPPGVSIAGALTYIDRNKSAAAATALRGATGGPGWLFAALITGAAPPNVQLGLAENDVGLTATIDDGLARGLLNAASIFARGVR